jgi:hypothetical protein
LAYCSGVSQPQTDDTRPQTTAKKAKEMSDAGTQPCPVAKIQRRLRRDEAMVEMVRAERVFLASRGRPNIPATPDATCRLVQIGLEVPSK